LPLADRPLADWHLAENTDRSPSAAHGDGLHLGAKASTEAATLLASRKGGCPPANRCVSGKKQNWAANKTVGSPRQEVFSNRSYWTGAGGSGLACGAGVGTTYGLSGAGAGAGTGAGVATLPEAASSCDPQQGDPPQDDS